MEFSTLFTGILDDSEIFDIETLEIYIDDPECFVDGYLGMDEHFWNSSESMELYIEEYGLERVKKEVVQRCEWLKSQK